MNTHLETIDAIERALDAKVAEIKASLATVRQLVVGFAVDGEMIAVPISSAPMPDSPAGRAQSKATTGAASRPTAAPVRATKTRRGRPRGVLTAAVEEAILSFQEFSSSDIERHVAAEDPDLDLSESAISNALYQLAQKHRITLVSVDGRVKRYRRNESFQPKEAA